MFQEGKISIIVSNYMAMNDFRNGGLQYDIAPLPHFHESSTLLVAIRVGMSSRTKHKEAISGVNR